MKAIWIATIAYALLSTLAIASLFYVIFSILSQPNLIQSIGQGTRAVIDEFQDGFNSTTPEEE
jgi:hypothetical protein